MLDLYLLNETFTNGSNHALLTFVSLASAINGIFLIISKNTFFCVIFLSIAGLSIIILLASQVGEYEQGVIQDSKQISDEKDKKRGSQLDLVHCPYVNELGTESSNKVFVWDKNDRSGTKLAALFFPSNNQTMQGFAGLVITQNSTTWDPINRIIKPKFPIARLTAMLANGDTIASNGQGLDFILPTPAAPSLARAKIHQNA